MELLFWLCITAIAYTYIGYVGLLHVISGTRSAIVDSVHLLRKDERRTRPVDSVEGLPRLAVVISAYNEESCIERRVNNLLRQDYPKALSRFLIGSDGSTDATGRVLGRYSGSEIEFFNYEINRGKASVLNDLVNEVHEDIIVFSDANTEFEPNALTQLARHFADPAVGAVCGELQIVAPAVADSANQDSVYWKLERILKLHEARIGALLGANGAIYAIRRSLYQNLPQDTLIDDFTIVMRVALQGAKVVYDPQAKATEETAPDVEGEFHRRVRIGTGNYQAFTRLLEALNPRHGWLAFTYFSHKVLRWFTPQLAVLALLANMFLLDSSAYLFLFVVQITGYVFFGWHAWRRSLDTLPGPLRAMGFLFLMNVAFMLGFMRFISGDNAGSWARTSR